MVGQNVGKYRILDRIGKGGMGTVYRAMDETLHRDVAIKVLNAELNDPEVAKRFRAEAITVARLSHPGIATIYELFEHEGQWLMVMEYVRGETLEGMVGRMGPLSAQRAAELCMQALAALAHAHSMGVVHRDLKPANLMVTENGSVKVMDFGIARVTGSEHMTNAGFMMGTPAYMAPEQVRGGDVDARADLYAMGVVFYRLTTAKLPFKGDTAFAMVQSQVNDPHTPIGLIREDLPGWVEEIVTRSLAKAPEARFQSAAEFHEALARCLAGLTIASMYTASGDTLLTPARMPSGAFTSRAMPMPMGTPSAGYALTSSQPTIAAPGTNPDAISLPTDPTMVVQSGATVIHTPRPPVAGAPPVAPAPAKADATKGRTTKGKQQFPVMWLGAAGVVVIGGVIVGVMMMKGRGAQDPGATPTPTVTAEATPSPTVDPAVAGATGTGAIDPATQTAGAQTAVTATPTPLTTPTASPRPTTTPGATTANATPTPARGRATGTGTEATAATPTSTPAPTSAPAANTGGSEADPLVTFPDVRMFVFEGKRPVDKEAVLNLGSGQVMVMPKTGGTAMAALPYGRITHATYIKARGPKWDPALSSPPEGVDAGSFSGGLIRTARHWLVLQGADHIEIFRLEDANFERILQTLETRARIKIDRQK